MASEAAAFSKTHKKWIVEYLNECEGKKCTYEDLVKQGEGEARVEGSGKETTYTQDNSRHMRYSYEKTLDDKHCDTLGAMLKLLKKMKAIHFDGMFLMYDMHWPVEIKLTASEELFAELTETLILGFSFGRLGCLAHYTRQCSPLVQKTNKLKTKNERSELADLNE
jgi:hypothetical protein